MIDFCGFSEKKKYLQIFSSLFEVTRDFPDVKFLFFLGYHNIFTNMVLEKFHESIFRIFYASKITK